jgi:diketogulonate reductase-like aldo/keto reductase
MWRRRTRGNYAALARARAAAASSRMSVPTLSLADGVAIPVLGLGVYQSPPGRTTRDAVRWALEAGYRHIDTASAYGNERDVGTAIRASGLAREEVFVTTKLRVDDAGYESGLAAFDASLERLGFDRIDLYLIHWPVEHRRLDAWRALERVHAEGRARAIGVSNYLVRHLEELLAVCDTPPAVNQIELSPFNYRTREDTVVYCREHGIVIEAYSPLTKARRLQDPTVLAVARKHGRTPAQVLIRYDLEKHTVVLPKSVHRERILENADVFGFRLDRDDVASLDALDEGLATGWDPTDAP